jgi:putative hydrolase of the HAD superfamily
MSPRIRAVFFDAVGTLLFPQPSAPEMYHAVALKQGCDLPVDVIRERFLAAYRLEEEADRANRWITSERREVERWQRIVASTLREVTDPAACFRGLFDHFSRASSWRLHDGAEAVFRKLRDRGLILGMGTNYDSRIGSVIAGMPALAVLDRVVVSASIGRRKPAQEFFQEVVRLAGCAPREVLFVGDDRDNDYDGSRAAGLQALLIEREAGQLLPPLENVLTYCGREGPP